MPLLAMALSATSLLAALCAAHRAGISVALGVILRFIAPQGRHVAPMG